MDEIQTEYRVRTDTGDVTIYRNQYPNGKVRIHIKMELRGNHIGFGLTEALAISNLIKSAAYHADT